jgi:uncharacterized LabA/DUF88 family protein
MEDDIELVAEFARVVRKASERGGVIEILPMTGIASALDRVIDVARDASSE